MDWNKIKFDMWNKRFGEGTDFDLDYGKLLIIALLVYHILRDFYIELEIIIYLEIDMYSI